MNTWQKILELVNEVQGTNIKMGEEFEIAPANYNPCKFTEKGCIDCEGDDIGEWLYSILVKDATIKTTRQKPKVGDEYIHIAFCVGNFITQTRFWTNNEINNNKWDNGLAFHPHEKDKAERVIEKMLEVARNEAKNDK